jgi:hypothetical protein
VRARDGKRSVSDRQVGRRRRGRDGTFQVGSVSEKLKSRVRHLLISAIGGYNKTYAELNICRNDKGSGIRRELLILARQVLLVLKRLLERILARRNVKPVSLAFCSNRISACHILSRVQFGISKELSVEPRAFNLDHHATHTNLHLKARH